MADATITTSTNNRYRTVEGTMQQVVNYLDSFKVPVEQIIGMGYSGISNQIFFATFRLSGA